MNKYSGDIVKNIFRLLSLEELNELASTKKKYKVVPLTEIVLTELKGAVLDLEKMSSDFYSKPKKIDAKESEADKEEKAELEGKEEESGIYYRCAKNVDAILAEYNYRCQEAEKKVFSPEVRKKKRSRKMQMSKFILEERKKLEEANFKLKRQESINLYRENGSVSLGQGKKGENKHPNSDLSGILIKKRV